MVSSNIWKTDNSIVSGYMLLKYYQTQSILLYGEKNYFTNFIPQRTKNKKLLLLISHVFDTAFSYYLLQIR